MIREVVTLLQSKNAENAKKQKLKQKKTKKKN